MKQLMVVIFMVSFVMGAEHRVVRSKTPTGHSAVKKAVTRKSPANAPVPQVVHHTPEQAVPVGFLKEMKEALRDPDTLKALAWVVSIPVLHFAPYYGGEWCPEAVFIMGLAKYVALTPVCLLASGLPLKKPCLVDMCVLGSFVALCSVFWYQYADIFWGIQEWIIERSGGEDRGWFSNSARAAAERMAMYWGWGGRGKK